MTTTHIETSSNGLPAMLDFFDPGFHHHNPAVAAAREAHWYARTPIGFAVLRYAEAAELLRDNRLKQGGVEFLAAQGVTEGPAADWMRHMLLCVEGADHTRLRRLVSKAFTPRAVDKLRPHTRRLANELIDGFAAAGECEFMSAFADRLPALVISQMLEIPRELHEPCHHAVADLGQVFSWHVAQRLPRIEAAIARLDDIIDTLVAERRSHPGDDLISALVAAHEAGDSLTDHELRQMVSTLLFASQDTTRNQLGLAVATFAEHPDQWALLARAPEQGAGAVEEVIRVNPAVPCIWRVAAEELTYRDLYAQAGTSVTIQTSAANTDPRVFGDAEFDITATRAARQLSFGAGPHSCLGMGLARLELAEALPILAQRLGPIRLATEPTYLPPTTIYGPLTLPVRFTQVP
ncbi:MAG: cytochrome P450, partial [Pseudonocardia sp.]|nr:cytochrome P450 [Pseudonocardia sp.]